MSAAAPQVDSGPSATDDRRPGLRAAALDALVVAVWFAVAGLLGALLWWQVTPLPTVTRTDGNATLAPEELVKQVGIDGWFFVIALVAGVVSGAVLLAWRNRDPLLMVVLVVLGGALASWLMIHLGLSLGPGREVEALRNLPDGAEVSMRLRLHAPGIAWVWPIAAAIGSLVHIWVLRRPDQPQDQDQDGHQD
jgi:hypothetical protein